MISCRWNHDKFSSYSMMLLNLCVILPNGKRHCLNHKAHFHCFKLVTFPMTIKISFKFHYFHFKSGVSDSVACKSRLSCHVSCNKVYPTSGQMPSWLDLIKREWLFPLDLIHIQYIWIISLNLTRKLNCLFPTMA